MSLLCASAILCAASQGYGLHAQLAVHAAEAAVEDVDDMDEEDEDELDEDTLQTYAVSVEELGKGKKLSKIFPDYGLAKHMSYILDKAHEDDLVTQVELDSITEIYPAGTNHEIKSLEGLQHLRNLSTLHLYEASFNDLKPIVKLRKLTEVNFYHSHISDISALSKADWPELRYIDLTGTNVFDLSPLKSAYMPKIDYIAVDASQKYDEIPSVVGEGHVTIDNPVRGIDGTVVAPEGGYGLTEDDGFSYNDGKLVWDLRELPSEVDTVYANWYYTMPIGNGYIYFNGKYAVNVSKEHYRVNFMYDSGAVSLSEAPSGHLVQAPAERWIDTGKYDFLGWYTQPIGGKMWNFASDKMPARTLNLYARYRAKKLNVTFNNEGATKQKKVLADHKIKEPKQPEKRGFTFVGWSTSPDEEYLWDFKHYTVNEDMTLYAVFAAPLTVTYNTDGVESQVSVDYGGKLTEPAQPEKVGFAFVGWSPYEDGTYIWRFDEDEVFEDMTLYAVFAE